MIKMEINFNILIKFINETSEKFNLNIDLIYLNQYIFIF